MEIKRNGGGRNAGALYTDTHDFALGPDEVYQGPVSGMTPKEFGAFLRGFGGYDGMPGEFRSAVMACSPERVEAPDAPGLYARLMVCDTGPGGAVSDVGEESPSYRLFA
jgi:hypothetical protein